MTSNIATTGGKIPVKCYPVTIPGFEEYQFIIHRSLSYEGWDVSEFTTGQRTMPSSWAGGLSNKTRAGAIAIAREYLERNRERLKNAIERERP